MERRHCEGDSRTIIKWVARGEGTGGLGGKSEGIKKCRVVATKQSQGCKVQRRKYSH